ncbi:facilitated trehalose transporter Tret1-like [Macrobrachium rosenbergii]|uniref:facilitated trehalose transporter Tret1-like n=1 Tax=Macrobrachium rosenbergii TaxID=79674 RepID=UPI0034D62410
MCRARGREAESGENQRNTTEDGGGYRQSQGRLTTQLFACLAVSLSNLSAGAVNGWTAAALPSMKEDPAIVLTTADIAWMASIISVGCMLGSIFAGRVMDLIGRRMTLIVLAPFLLVGWLTIALASNTTVILLGRMICGTATAFLYCASPVYCSEVPEARLRGSLGLMPSLFITFGIVLSYMAGAFFSWRVSCHICSIPVILMFIVLWVVPESPYWYLLKGKTRECKASLRWLRGPRYDFSSELEEMEAKITSVGREVEYCELWRPRTRWPFLISLFMATLQQVSGGNILVVFTGLIFISAGVENPRMAVVSTGIIQIIFTFLCLMGADRLGRRPLIIVSTCTIGLANTLLGFYYLMSNVYEIQWPPSVPLVTILTAIAGFCLGCRAMPWLLSTELFNTTIRSTANSASIFYNRLLNVTILQVYPFYEEAFGAHAVFFTFGSLSLLCSVVAYFVVPETKGKTLEQIQEYFESTRSGSRGQPYERVDGN